MISLPEMPDIVRVQGRTREKKGESLEWDVRVNPFTLAATVGVATLSGLLLVGKLDLPNHLGGSVTVYKGPLNDEFQGAVEKYKEKRGIDEPRPRDKQTAPQPDLARAGLSLISPAANPLFRKLSPAVNILDIVAQYT